MRVIVVGSERGLFDPESSARSRIASYGPLFEETHIIVFTGRGKMFVETKIAENVFVHPTRSWTRFLYIHDAQKVARRLQTDFSKRPAKDGKTVVSAQDPFEAGLTASKIARILSAGLHLQVHTDFLSPYFATSLLNRWRVGVARKLIPTAQRIRVVSESLKRRISSTLSIPGERIDVLPVFVDTTRFDTGDSVHEERSNREHFSQFKFVILMASRLSPEKDIGLAIRAFARIKEHTPDVGLVIVGKGSQGRSLRFLARRLGCAGHVTFIPWHHDMLPLFQSANAFLLTSQYEGYGVALVEAGLSGLPIVTTRVGIAEEMCDGEEALVCDVGDIDCLARRLFELISYHSVRGMLRVNGRIAMRRYVLTRDEYMQRYQQTLQASALSTDVQ
jgi:glycosyltransferase involved in cell wall biosynthesis